MFIFDRELMKPHTSNVPEYLSNAVWSEPTPPVYCPYRVFFRQNNEGGKAPPIGSTRWGTR